MKHKIIIPNQEQKCTCKENDPYCCQIHGICPTCVIKQEPKEVVKFDNEDWKNNPNVEGSKAFNKANELHRLQDDKKETLEKYIDRLKQRRTEDEYKYTDDDFEKHKEYIADCWETNLSVYKCLEFMYFENKKQETLEEAANRKYGSSIYDIEQVDAFVSGGKYQEQRMFSNGEVLELLQDFANEIQEVDNIRNWFNQYKKK